MPLLLHLTLLPGRYAVCRLAAGEPLPAWAMATDAPLWSLTRTRDELSVVVEEAGVPPSVEKVEPGWRALALAGPIPFGTVGVIAGLTAPLAAAHVPVFVISTYDTDVLLVKATDLETAVATLRGAGVRVDAAE
jgi:uncharacterized protein